MTNLQRSKSLALTFLVGAFLIGAALGVVGHKAYITRPYCHYRAYPSYAFHLGEQYGLADAQVTTIDSIFSERDSLYERAYAPYKSITDSIDKRIRERSDSLDSAMVRVFTPEQRTKYDHDQAKQKACNDQWKHEYDSVRAVRKAKRDSGKK